MYLVRLTSMEIVVRILRQESEIFQSTNDKKDVEKFVDKNSRRSDVGKTGEVMKTTGNAFPC